MFLEHHARRVRLLGVLTPFLATALAPHAEAAGARVRWTASTDPRVAGYRLYMRRAGTPFNAPIDAGRPAAAADGSVAYVVNGLTAGQTYRFAVTAYGVAPLESGLSQEKALGATDPCLVDVCTSPTTCSIHVAADGSSCDDGLFCNGIAVCRGGVCQNGPAPNCSDGVACTTDHCDDALARCMHVSQPGCCTTDAECIDTDQCTSAERCVSGTCVSLGAACASPSCTDAFCDPRSGCGLMPTPDGLTCDETCDPLVPRRLVVAANSQGAGLNLRSTFATTAVIDPSVTGVTVEVSDASGAVAYRATVPGELFAAKGEGTKFRYLAHGDEAFATGGISGVVLKKRHGVWALNVRAAALDLYDSMSQLQLGVTVRFGATCAHDLEVLCTLEQGRARCR